MKNKEEWAREKMFQLLKSREDRCDLSGHALLITSFLMIGAGDVLQNNLINFLGVMLVILAVSEEYLALRSFRLNRELILG